eukprot:COSAG01_NODE_7590_length_3134_cov_3.172266_4_plen_72_part_00
MSARQAPVHLAPLGPVPRPLRRRRAAHTGFSMAVGDGGGIRPRDVHGFFDAQVRPKRLAIESPWLQLTSEC